MENIILYGQWNHCNKMGADSSAENTQNASEFICPIFCPSPKVLDFNEKRLQWASVVRGLEVGRSNDDADGFHTCHF